MNQVLKYIPFPVKLILIALVPLLFVVYMTAQIQAEKQQKLEIVEKFNYDINLAATINALKDNLQQERRITFSYSLNKKNENRMIIERSETDRAIARLEEEGGARIEGFKSYMLLDELPKIRAIVDTDSADPGEIIDYYTNLILRLNTLAPMFVNNLPYLQPITRELEGQRLLSEMITYLGIVRANIYYYLYTDRRSAEQIAETKAVYSNYKSFEKEFFLKSSESSVLAYKNLLKTGNFSITISTVEKLINTNTIDTGITTEGWRDLSAKGVDDLKKLQRNMVDQLLAKTQGIYGNESKERDFNLVFLLAVIAVVIAIVIIIIKNISDNLSTLKVAAEKIAKGSTGLKINVPSKDIIGDLSKSVILIDENNVLLTTAANEIGRGNFDVKIKPRSEEDDLGNALLKMKNDLQRFTLENEEKIWVQTGISKINDSIRGERDLQSLANEALEALIAYLHAEVALFYIAENEALHYTAGYAIDNTASVKTTIAFGQGLTGKVAETKRLQYLNNLPGDYLKISSASGSLTPDKVIIIPLVHNNSLEGIIEMAAVESFDNKSMELINHAAANIAVSIQAAKSRNKLQELLEETQAQAEELQTQHEEMENLNVELEAQAQKLQASEEELKVQQEELQQTNIELEERSRQLEEKNHELYRKAEELALSTRYKSEFLANMSHELRTPLNSILLLSRLLADNKSDNLNKDQVEYARVIQSSGNGLLSLIDEILDLSKIEAGKMELEYSQVPVDEISRDISALFQPMATEKGLEFIITKAPDAPESVFTDKMRLEQVLKNLLSNALKFTANGSVALTIRPDNQHPGMLSFIVKDTGIGISKEKQKLVFEAFQQADGSTRRKYGGTGLGLSISRELARLLGGELTLTSEPGIGSEFTLTVPVAKGQSVKAIEEHREIPEPETPHEAMETDRYISPTIPESVEDDRNKTTTDDQNILIVEDDTNFAKSLLEFTRNRGYKGIVSVRGDEALEMAIKYKPTGILLDIQLPVKSGWEVMDELKKNPATRHIPVHIMSSYEVKSESLLKGAVDFINKPVAYEKIQDLFQKIEYVLSRNPKKVLILEENAKHAKALAYYLENFKINSEVKGNLNESIEAFNNKDVDCVILDMGIPSQKAYDILEEARKNETLENIPIIIFTGKSLSKAEESKIRQYADSIIVKTAHSYQRLLDEVSLFLHMVEENKKGGNSDWTSKKLGALDEILKNKTVLVVDDDVRNVFSLTKALENLKMKVVTATDGKEALQRLQENDSTDIVLLDMMMPEMDGYETAAKIRQNPKWKNLPVIAVTAKAMTGDREKCINAGASDYITKPVDIDQLLSLLRVWLYER
ncbi:MAG TPA: response regulator [Bacteroidia bacterium]|nr:response regulator [Bacteroidia bacterium]